MCPDLEYDLYSGLGLETPVFLVGVGSIWIPGPGLSVKK